MLTCILKWSPCHTYFSTCISGPPSLILAQDPLVLGCVGTLVFLRIEMVLVYTVTGSTPVPAQGLHAKGTYNELCASYVIGTLQKKLSKDAKV